MIVEQVECRFRWREPGRRPELPVAIYPATRRAWPLFRPFHYMAADLNASARCFLLDVDGRTAAFAATLNFPHAARRDIRRVHRVVVLPDWQGLGLGMILIDRLGGGYRAIGQELRLGTRSVTFARSLARSPRWTLVCRGALNAGNARSRVGKRKHEIGTFGGRLGVTTYRFVGPADPSAASKLLGASLSPSAPGR